MGHFREPIKHTCPDIDRIIKAINNIQRRCSDRNLKHIESADELRDVISEIESDCWGLESDLEQLRKSNEELRAWGVEEAEEVDKLNEIIESLNID